ncbi:calcium-binding protein [Actinoplanes sp. GCM10030250]|uniref:calcium-binding protein n=1 Tax=Actinoplanes sp. GCM10030250 TaxID=3273376 RepID=UPI003618F279
MHTRIRDLSHVLLVTAAMATGPLGTALHSATTALPPNVHVAGSTLFVTADVNRWDNIRVTMSNGDFVVNRTGNAAYLRPGARCAPRANGTLLCQGEHVTSVRIDTGDFTDSIVAAVTVPVTAKGGTGRDTINMSGQRAPHNTLYGGGGNDTVIGSAHADTLLGDEQDDTLDGLGGADVFAGGTGRDHVTYASRGGPVIVTSDRRPNDGGLGERDNVGSDVEDVTGGRGADRLFGNSLDNRLAGNGGDDVLVGDRGRDDLVAGAGSDTLLGGAGRDRLYADDNDSRLDVLFGDADRDLCVITPADMRMTCEVFTR